MAAAARRRAACVILALLAGAALASAASTRHKDKRERREDKHKRRSSRREGKHGDKRVDKRVAALTAELLQQLGSPTGDSRRVVGHVDYRHGKAARMSVGEGEGDSFAVLTPRHAKARDADAVLSQALQRAAQTRPGDLGRRH